MRPTYDLKQYEWNSTLFRLVTFLQRNGIKVDGTETVAELREAAEYLEARCL